MTSPPHSIEHFDVDTKGMDVAKHERVEIAVGGVSWTPEEEKKLLRRIDLQLMPIMWLMYLLSYMDRTNIGNAKVAGMQEDLNLTSNQYSICLVVFFVTYVVFEVPSNMLIVRIRPSIYLPCIMTVWGALTCCMAAVKDYEHLVVLRIFVGVFEAGFAPAMLLLMSSWYKREEQSKRFGIYISAAILSGAFGGLLAGAITGGLDGAAGYEGWRWLFIIEGAATILVALLSYFILIDFPATTARFSDRERAIAVARLEQGGVTARAEGAERMSKVQAFTLAIKDWRTIGFILGYMVIVGSSTLSYFYPTLVHGLGYTSTVQAQYMTCPIYGVAFVCTAITAVYADRVPNHRGLIIACWLCFSLITSILVCVVYNFTARYALLVLMAAGLWASNAISLSYAGATFGDMEPEVRGIALALVNALGNLAQIYGAYLFPADDKPKYLLGFGVISAMLGIGVVVYTIMHIRTRRKDGMTNFFRD
ncbi:MFS general substrate transporter [Karstenula rhodostoma CBS 690.94]|uniref:MFS general substrate transporter n=1 Tax=Karstenula rhodostoma CBS 690.94 TaxID=1392251 RepID=A0A9P4P6N2_9PLEO|nr:MFS general substrate transporter [Karstenula rhodostoma CBS 690.94]